MFWRQKVHRNCVLDFRTITPRNVRCAATTDRNSSLLPCDDLSPLNTQMYFQDHHNYPPPPPRINFTYFTFTQTNHINVSFTNWCFQKGKGKEKKHFT